MSENSRVVVLGSLAPQCLGYLREQGLHVDVASDWSEQELLDRIDGYDALIAEEGSEVVAGVLRAAARLRVVGRTGSSVDDIAVDEATRRGILVVNAPQANVVSEVEHALAMLLACAHGVALIDADLRARSWHEDAWSSSSVEVRGKTLGIIDSGAHAAAIADGALALGMEVLVFDPLKTAERPAEASSQVVDDPRWVYRAADVLMVRLPSRDDTRGIIGAEEFAQMKDGVLIVGLAGAGVVDESAWLGALESGKAAASVVAIGPAEDERAERFSHARNVTLTARLETSTSDARARACMETVEQIVEALDGGLPKHAVNVAEGTGDDAAELMPYIASCTQLGAMALQLADGPVEALDIEYGGSFAYYDTRVLTLGVLAGALSREVDERVNFVNARLIADERGVKVTERTEPGVPDFPRLITVAASGPTGQVSVSGTWLGPEHKPRLVKLFGEDVDIRPAPHMAVLRYVDAPGIGGALGTLLGQWGVNISHMTVGRGALGDEAVMGLALDQPLSERQVDELVESCGLAYGRRIEL
jgi:D-3-phosphoglycerate dehydrogenase